MMTPGILITEGQPCPTSSEFGSHKMVGSHSVIVKNNLQKLKLSSSVPSAQDDGGDDGIFGEETG